MDTESIWQTYSGVTHFPALEGEIEVDVAIIGGGICGITCAQLLSDSGLKVAVVEAGKIGESNTGHSTGNLYDIYGELLNQTRNYFNPEIVSQIVSSRKEAVDLIERNINHYNIDCDFRRVPWFYFSAHKDADTYIVKAKKTLEEIERSFEYGTFSDSRMRPRKAIKVHGQAQFNPLRYVQGLAQAIAGEKCLIFEDSKVEEIHEGESKELITSIGKVNAKKLIHATHSPKGLLPLHAMLGPYREYGIACKIKNPQLPGGIYWGLYVDQEITSIRQYERNGEHYLLVVGEAHKVGQGDSNYHLGRLENFAASHFEVEELTHRWGGQHYRPADHIPYIGRRSKGTKTYIATGFSTHGLVFGTVAASLISDLINGRENPFEDLYSPTRFNPMKSAPKFIKENVNVFKQMVKDYIGRQDEIPFADIARGEGKVVEFDGHKMAACRNEEGQLQVCSAICTHLGCVVHWNNAEMSWDCPCHGSRFRTDGEVIEGPALKALARSEEVTEDNFNTTVQSIGQDLFVRPESGE